LYWWNPRPLADGQHYQSDQPCRHSSPFLQKCHKLTLWIRSRAGFHEKGLHWLTTCWQKSNKNNYIHYYSLNP
jgi:hypothetical protein